jgi:pyruvate kinase
MLAPRGDLNVTQPNVSASSAAEFRRCKIVCTLGPATRDPEVLGALVDAGMNCARINFSHGAAEEHAATVRRVREVAAARGVAVAILADLQGPKIRVGAIAEPGITLARGDILVLSVDPNAPNDRERVSVDYPPLATEVRAGDPILMDDGALEAVVERVVGTEIETRIVTGGVLKARKGVNLPHTKLSLPSLTDKDKRDLRLALELGVDIVALSFVRKPADLDVAREVMAEVGRHVPLVAKVEKPEAVANLQAIVESAEGIMVARGDLGVEMGPEEVPLVQKRAIDLCNARGRLVITATQMLDSMIRNPRPTRAEASDVANAVFDGTDAVMLSGETAMGQHPVLVVETMARIVRRAERETLLRPYDLGDMGFGHGPNAIARSAVASARSLSDTRAIVVYTGSGGSARLISDYRPHVPIHAFTPNQTTYQSLAVYWGVVPHLFSPTTPTEHGPPGAGASIFVDLDRALLERGVCERGDRVVVVMGYPVQAGTSANLLKLHIVGESLHAPGTP